jgi:polyisoprenoid-binding protein YceI
MHNILDNSNFLVYTYFRKENNNAKGTVISFCKRNTKIEFLFGGNDMTTQPGETQAATRSIWQLDPNHTLVEFVGKHMMITTVRGRFKGVRGTIVYDEADPSRSSVEVEIDARSLDSGVEYRDNHLKSADFLDVEHFPTITFKSTRVEPQGDDRAKVIGDLTIRDVTREVVLDTELTGGGKSPMGKQVLAFDAKTSINRKDWGLTWNLALETGGWLVADTIKIEIAAEGIKQD